MKHFLGYFFVFDTSTLFDVFLCLFSFNRILNDINDSVIEGMKPPMVSYQEIFTVLIYSHN